MLLPKLISLFLILYSAPSSIAAEPSQNDRVSLNCEILRRTDECSIQQCIAGGARWHVKRPGQQVCRKARAMGYAARTLEILGSYTNWVPGMLLWKG
jgi:hypothetical protein